MLDSKVLNTDYDLAEMRDLCLPNLLMNADFKSGIINQRGQTTYTVTNKTTFMIDRWRTYYGTLEVNDGYVKFTDTDSSSARAFEQWIDDFGDGTFTIYVNVKSLSGNVRIQLMDHTASLISEKQLSVGDNVLTADGAVRLVRFYVPIGANIEIYQVKLEKGSVFTGMPVWDYAVELLKCQRYYLPLGEGWGNMYNARSDTSFHRVYIRIPCNMAKNPSFLYKPASNVRFCGLTNAPEQQCPISNFYAIQMLYPFVLIDFSFGTTKPFGYGFALFENIIALDAETY